MYKGSGRFHQGLRESGKPAAPTGSRSPKAKPNGKPKGRFLRGLDDAAATRRLQEWFSYIEVCARDGKPPTGVPARVLEAFEAAQRARK
jgi:hypothetical protein